MARSATPRNLASELLHPPGEPAGVEERKIGDAAQLATELLHLPHEAAGIRHRTSLGKPRETTVAARTARVRPGGRRQTTPRTGEPSCHAVPNSPHRHPRA